MKMTVAEEESQNGKHEAAKKLNQQYRESFRSEHKAAKDVKRYQQELERAVVHASRAEYVLGAKRENKRLERRMNTLLDKKETFNFNQMCADSAKQRMRIAEGKNAVKAQRVLDYKTEKEQTMLDGKNGKNARQSRLKGRR